MCGIAGWVKPGNSADEGARVADAMVSRQLHRGPDGRGVESGNGWALGHARLAVIDPAGGKQPIWNFDRTAVIVGNNEIYNAPELRAQLETQGHRFQTGSDTEVALRSYEAWGIEGLRKLRGMFAIAIVDLKSRKLVLARDFLGVKPLQITRVAGGIAFSSEVKGLQALPGVRLQPDLDSLHLFMNLRFVPGDTTLFGGVDRLTPGTAIEVFLDTGQEQRHTLFDWKQAGARRAHHPSLSDSAEELYEILRRSVDRHMISDVEVCAYLSGGLDSSTVVSFASKRKPGMRSFCVSFGAPSDENKDARLAAQAFGTHHEDLSLGTSPLDRYSSAIRFVEEPKVNCLQGLLLAEQVNRRGVKVALSGLGGDELFAGYVNSDLLYPSTLVSRLGLTGATRAFPRATRWLGDFKPLLFDQAVRAGELLLNLHRPVQSYAILRNAFDHNEELVRSIYGKPRPSLSGMTTRALDPYFDSQNEDVMNELLRLEMRTKLINDFLLTEDRVSMASGVETRVPLLDQELVEFALSLPSSFKYRPGQRKRILRRAMREHLPSQLFSKPKWGFSFDPVFLFPRGLKGLASQVLTQEAVQELGLFNWKWIRSVLDARPSPELRWHYFTLWVMTGIVLWHQEFFRD